MVRQIIISITTQLATIVLGKVNLYSKYRFCLRMISILISEWQHSKNSTINVRSSRKQSDLNGNNSQACKSNSCNKITHKTAINASVSFALDNSDITPGRFFQVFHFVFLPSQIVTPKYTQLWAKPTSILCWKLRTTKTESGYSYLDSVPVL
jgi:hypothetical protein